MMIYHFKHNIYIRIAIAIILGIIAIVFVSKITSCNNEPIPQLVYENHLIIDDTLKYPLIAVKYWSHNKTIELKPENGTIVLRYKHDSIVNGYMVVNGLSYHYDSIVSIVNITDRAIGYAYGNMMRATCPPSGNYKFVIKYNLLL